MKTPAEIAQTLRQLLLLYPNGTHFCLKEKKEGWALSGELLIEMMDGYEAAITEERARTEKTLTALKFYANETNWQEYATKVLEDTGELAREVLKELGEHEKT